MCPNGDDAAGPTGAPDERSVHTLLAAAVATTPTQQVRPLAEATLPATVPLLAPGVAPAQPPASATALRTGPPAATAHAPPPSPQPVFEYGEPIGDTKPLNLAYLRRMTSWLGGAFSFMCTMRMDGIHNWSRIFDFSLVADDDSITAGAIGGSLDLHFTVFRGKKPISVRVPEFFVLGQEATVLFTVSEAGHMRVMKNGMLYGENVDGFPPLLKQRPHMIVGGHFQHLDQRIRGEIKTVRVWDQEVSWQDVSDASVQ